MNADNRAFQTDFKGCSKIEKGGFPWQESGALSQSPESSACTLYVSGLTILVWGWLAMVLEDYTL